MENKKQCLGLTLISFCIGLLNEFIAYVSSVWIYHPWWLTFINLIVMFVIVMPFVAHYLRDYSYQWVFFVGFVVGLIYEFSDLYILHWTTFPEGHFLFVYDPIKIRIVIAVLWGFVPMFTLWLWNFIQKQREGVASE